MPIITNLAGLPQPLVDAVKNDPYDDGGANISVTRLIAPARQVALQKLHHNEIAEDAADRIWSLIGQIGHTILERAGGSNIVEKRFFADIAGWKVSGQADILDNKSILDYKLTSVWTVKDGLKPEWEQQINLLALLADLNQMPIGDGKIVAIFRDWSTLEAKRSADYPKQQVRVMGVPIWPREKTMLFAVKRVIDHQRAQAGQLPFCTALERWEKPTVWAVMKKGNMRAVKLHDSLCAATDHVTSLGPNHEVQIRPGQSVRCESYCNVSGYCSQAKALTDRGANNQ